MWAAAADLEAEKRASSKPLRAPPLSDASNASSGTAAPVSIPEEPEPILDSSRTGHRVPASSGGSSSPEEGSRQRAGKLPKQAVKGVKAVKAAKGLTAVAVAVAVQGAGTSPRALAAQSPEHTKHTTSTGQRGALATAAPLPSTGGGGGGGGGGTATSLPASQPPAPPALTLSAVRGWLERRGRIYGK